MLFLSYQYIFWIKTGIIRYTSITICKTRKGCIGKNYKTCNGSIRFFSVTFFLYVYHQNHGVHLVNSFMSKPSLWHAEPVLKILVLNNYCDNCQLRADDVNDDRALSLIVGSLGTKSFCVFNDENQFI